MTANLRSYGWFATLLMIVPALAPMPAIAQAELVVWHGYRAGEKTAFEKVVEEFNQAQAGKIKVNTLAVPWDAYPDKVTAAVPRGKGPDVFIYPQDRLGGWIEAGNTIEPIDSDERSATIEEFLQTYIHGKKDPERLRRMLASRDLGQAWREFFGMLLG